VKPLRRPVRRTEIATLVTGAILVLAGLLPTAGEVDRRALLLTAGVTFGYALLWFRLLPQDLFGPWHFDIGMLTPVAIGVLLLSLTGGSASTYFPLYFLPILGTAFGMEVRTPLIAGGLAVIAYLWLFVGNIADGRPGDLQLGVVRLIFLIVLIAFVWLIVRTLHAARERLQARTEELAVLTTEVEAVVRTAHSAVISMDATGRITRWNDQAVRTFGRDEEAVIGRELADLIIPERYREAHRSGLRRFLATGEGKILGQRLELEALHANGTEFPVELTVAAHGSGDRRRFTGFITDITARRAAEADLTHRAFHDALTGLPNRALLEDRLERALAQARRGGGPTSVLLMDLDLFKEVNDRLGHEVGDRVLALFAARLQRTVRERTPPPGSAATSSSSCSRGPIRQAPGRSLRACSAPARNRWRSAASECSCVPASASPPLPKTEAT